MVVSSHVVYSSPMHADDYFLKIIIIIKDSGMNM